MTYVVKFSSNTGNFDVDEQITQATTGAIGRVVEWDNSRKLLYYQQERFSSYGTALRFNHLHGSTQIILVSVVLLEH